jgi:hypothetical protein
VTLLALVRPILDRGEGPADLYAKAGIRSDCPAPKNSSRSLSANELTTRRLAASAQQAVAQVLELVERRVADPELALLALPLLYLDAEP